MSGGFYRGHIAMTWVISLFDLIDNKNNAFIRNSMFKH